MKDILGIGILGVIGYYLYQHFYGTATTIANTNSNTANTNTPSQPIVNWNTVPSINAQRGSTALDIQNRLLALAGKDSLSFDQWNFYYHQLSNSYLIASDGLNTSTDLISVRQFLSFLPNVNTVVTNVVPGSITHGGSYNGHRGIGELISTYNGKSTMYVNGYERR